MELNISVEIELNISYFVIQIHMTHNFHQFTKKITCQSMNHHNIMQAGEKVKRGSVIAVVSLMRTGSFLVGM